MRDSGEDGGHGGEWGSEVRGAWCVHGLIQSGWFMGGG